MTVSPTDMYKRVKNRLDVILSVPVDKNPDKEVIWGFDTDSKLNGRIFMNIFYGKDSSSQFYDLFGSSYRRIIQNHRLAATIFLCPAGLKINVGNLEDDEQQIIVTPNDGTPTSREIVSILRDDGPSLVKFFDEKGWYETSY